jgi:hypothetical protein
MINFTMITMVERSWLISTWKLVSSDLYILKVNDTHVDVLGGKQE